MRCATAASFGTMGPGDSRVLICYDDLMSLSTRSCPSIFPEICLTASGGRTNVTLKPSVSASAHSMAATRSDGARTSSGRFADVERFLKEAVAAARRLDAELSRALAARDAAFRRFARASRFPLAPSLAWRLPSLRRRRDAAEETLQSKAAERNGCRIDVRLEFGTAAMGAFARLAAARPARARPIYLGDSSQAAGFVR
jgi:hypothetical protein